MITELSNYVDSLGDKLNWLLFESRKLEEGKYFFFETGEPGKDSVKLVNKFDVDANGEIVDSKESVHIFKNIKEMSYLRKYFLSRIVSTNKAIKPPDCKMIISNNPALIFFNADKLESAQKCIPLYVKKCFEFHKKTVEERQLETFLKEFEVKIIKILSEDQPEIKGKFFFFLNLSLDIFEEFAFKYFKEKIFLEPGFDLEEGVSTFKMVGFDKKPYTWSRTSNIKLPAYVSFQTALNLNILNYIFRFAKSYISSPLPIFIHEEQLNSEIINLIKENGKSSFREVFQKLFNYHIGDINNYYLLSWRFTKEGLEIYDFDYIEKFNYKLNEHKISPFVQNLYYTKEPIKPVEINNIFDFETEVVGPVFNNILVNIYKDTLRLNYFSDISKSLDKESKNYKLTIKNVHFYSFSFYEFIYKSKQSAISERILYTVVCGSILDLINSLRIPIKGVEPKLREIQHVKKIIHLLNILFSLNHKFDKNNTNFGGRNMPSEIPKYFERIGEIVKSSDSHIQDDYEYAFCAGQLIYYLLSQSQSGNKTHSLIEPFINRTTVESFNDQLIRVFNQYKHAISFNSRRFNRLFEEVIGYRPETGYKEMLPVLFAGYFGDNILYKSKETLEETN